MTAVEETGGCVPLSELVTGVTTRQCCRWVSPHTTHTSTPNTLWGVRWGTTPFVVCTLAYLLFTHTVNATARPPPNENTHTKEWVQVRCSVYWLSANCGVRNLFPALSLPSAPSWESEQIKSPQEVTLEGDRQPSAVVIVMTKELTASTHIG